MSDGSELCIHDLNPAWCAICLKPKKVVRESWTTTDPILTEQVSPSTILHTIAHFDSRCPGCNESIEAGDDIYKVHDEWLCGDCAHGAA